MKQVTTSMVRYPRSCLAAELRLRLNIAAASAINRATSLTPPQLATNSSHCLPLITEYHETCIRQQPEATVND